LLSASSPVQGRPDSILSNSHYLSSTHHFAKQQKIYRDVCDEAIRPVPTRDPMPKQPDYPMHILHPRAQSLPSLIVINRPTSMFPVQNWGYLETPNGYNPKWT
jgi:hypothetical protein